MPKINYATLASTEDFKAAASSIVKRGGTLKVDIGKALYCALVHIDTHGDYTSSVAPILEAIGLAMSKAHHKAATEWVLKYSWLAFDTATKRLVKDKTKVMKLEEAKLDTNWAATMPEPKSNPFDAQKQVDVLFAKFENEVTADRGVMDAFIDLIVAKAMNYNPNLAEDLVLALDPMSQNNIMAKIMARMNPANDQSIDGDQFLIEQAA